MNFVALMGRLTKDPEAKQTQTTNLTRFSLAVDRRGKRDEADFFNCTAFGKTADFICQYFKKGNRILISGRIQNDNYTASDGSKRSAVQIIVDQAEFCESKQQQTEKTLEPKPDENGFMDIPLDSLEELPFN